MEVPVCLRPYIPPGVERASGVKKASSRGEEVPAMHSHRFFSYIPTRSSFDTAYRKRLFASATLCKPLIRERLLHPKKLLWKQSGSGLCVSREPHLPRILIESHCIMLFHICQAEFMCMCICYYKIKRESFLRLNIASFRITYIRRLSNFISLGSPKTYANR